VQCEPNEILFDPPVDVNGFDLLVAGDSECISFHFWFLIARDHDDWELINDWELPLRFMSFLGITFVIPCGSWIDILAFWGVRGARDRDVWEPVNDWELPLHFMSFLGIPFVIPCGSWIDMLAFWGVRGARDRDVWEPVNDWELPLRFMSFLGVSFTIPCGSWINPLAFWGVRGPGLLQQQGGCGKARNSSPVAIGRGVRGRLRSAGACLDVEAFWTTI
jgi:hypothetical protein